MIAPLMMWTLLAVYTNNANGGAMRGFGINQVVFAIRLAKT